MRFLRFVVSLALLLALAVGALVYIGWYDVAADKPHASATEWFLGQVMDRSVEVRARGVQVPRLDDEAQVREGAEHYAGMCAGCHMAPGESDTSFPDALYPHPPRLTEPNDLTPAQQFWVIKHGIKMSAMPAWGGTHSDQQIWNIVAFVQKLPSLTPEQYKALVPAGGAEEHQHEHQHGAQEAPVQEPVPEQPHEHGDQAPKDASAPAAKAQERPEEKPKPKPDEPEQHETRP